MPADRLFCADLMVSNGSSNSIEAFKKNTKTEKKIATDTPGSFDTVQLQIWICKIAFFDMVFICRHGILNAIQLDKPLNCGKR